MRAKCTLHSPFNKRGFFGTNVDLIPFNQRVVILNSSLFELLTFLAVVRNQTYLYSVFESFEDNAA